jgi:hypothetical protein
MARKKTPDLQRRAPRRSPLPKILIVCEGTKTEVHYFREFIAFYRLSDSLVIEVKPSPKSPPIEIVTFAIGKIKEYDKIYCVMDRDTHETFDDALQIIEQAPEKVKAVLKLIISQPCFEYWLLLHFENSAKGYVQTSKSPCRNVMDDLEKHLPNYKKGDRYLFMKLNDRLNKALESAKKRLSQAKIDGKMNPSTEIHELILDLQNVKK